MAKPIDADVVAGYISMGNLKGLQKFVVFFFDWNQPVGQKQVPALVWITIVGLTCNAKLRPELLKIAEWLLQVGADPGHKMANKGGYYNVWQLSLEAETKIFVEWEGHSAVSFAFALISQFQRGKGGADWSCEQAFVESLVALLASSTAADVTVPQSTLDLWESMREMTDSHNVIFESGPTEILKAASPVLKAMLASAMKEGTSKRIEVKDSASSGVSPAPLVRTPTTRPCSWRWTWHTAGKSMVSCRHCA